MGLDSDADEEVEAIPLWISEVVGAVGAVKGEVVLLKSCRRSNEPSVAAEAVLDGSSC